MQRAIELFAFDIDGTLTDATTWYAGDEIGWVQRYSVRDGEALLRMVKRGVHVAPLSRNKTAVARTRMEHLKLETRWLGVSDKLAALDEMLGHYGVDAEVVCFVGDGPDDAEVMQRVGLGMAVRNAHPAALAAADVVLERDGGQNVVEAIEIHLGW